MAIESLSLSPKERRALLRRSPILTGAPDDALDQLVAAAEVIEVEAGTVFIRQGAEADAFFVIVLGEAEVVLEGTRREEPVCLDTLGAGSVVGETGPLVGEPRTATVRATSATVLLRVDRQAMLDVLADHPSLAEEVWTTVARRRMEALLASSRRFAGQETGARHWLVLAVTPLRLPAGSSQRLSCPGTLFVVSGQVEADTELGWTMVHGPALVPCIGPVDCQAHTDAVVSVGPPLQGLGG